MKKTFLFCVATIIFAAAFALSIWAQEKEGAAIITTQKEVAKLVGEALGFKEAYMANLKRRDITPLGDWNPEKPLTRDDFDAILIRLARRSPVVENVEPSKILDSMGFPPRDVSKEGIGKVLESEAFKRTTANPKLILCQSLIPLPVTYQVSVIVRDAGVAERGVIAGAMPTGTAPLPAVVITVTPPEPPGPPPGPPGPPPEPPGPPPEPPEIPPEPPLPPPPPPDPHKS